MQEDFDNLSREEKEKLLLLLSKKDERTRYNFISSLFPDEGELRRELYPKHIDFLNAGAEFTERAFIAGNRTGKSLTGLFELVTHATGNYPKWWKGKRFNRPIMAWLAADRGEMIRDSLQRDLVGSLGMGTGLIPKDSIVKEPTSLPGTPGAIGQYFIEHKTNGVVDGISTIIIKTYQAGKNAFEAAKVDVVMLDEECPLDIYVECQLRTMTTGGTVYLTFTPDSGLTDTVLHFFEKAKAGEREKYVVMVGWDDVPHLSEDMKSQLLATIPPHMRDVKTKGVPYLGSGAIYPIPESDFVVSPFKIPEWWPKAYGFDVGWNKTASIWGAYNRDEDCWYLYSEHYRGQAEPSVHAEAIKSRGSWMNGVIDPASRGRNQQDGSTLLETYMKLGLNLSIANNAVEAGILEVYERLSTGRIKVFNTLMNFLYEYRIYRRDDKGRIVKKNDHIMDATRYLIMSGKDILEHKPDEDEDRPIRSDRVIVGTSDICGY